MCLRITEVWKVLNDLKNIVCYCDSSEITFYGSTQENENKTDLDVGFVLVSDLQNTVLRDSLT